MSAPTAGPEPGRTSPWAVVAAITRVELLRLLKDRTSLFFMVVLPIGVISIIGTTINAAPDAVPVGVIDLDRTPASAQIIGALRDGGALTITVYDDREALDEDLQTQNLAGGVVIPAGFSAALDRGDTGTVDLLGDSKNQGAASLAAIIRGIIAREGSELAAARFATTEAGGTLEENRARADQAAGSAIAVPVVESTLGEQRVDSDNRFTYTAPANLILFVFINTVLGGTSLVESRRYGVSRRELAAPVTVGTIMLGEAGARFVVGLGQAALILAVGRLLFGVQWGDPVGVALVVVIFAALASSVAMLLGSFARSPDQAVGLGIPVSLALAMLGGCMWPLEIVPRPLQIVGHLTPHAWAMDALNELVFEGAGVVAVLPQLGVLLGMAVALGLLATIPLRRALTASTA